MTFLFWEDTLSHMIEKLDLNEEELNSNFEEFIEFIKKSFGGDRLTDLLDLYNEDCLGIETCTAPASISEHFHLAVPGGYLMHIMHVVKASYGVKAILEKMGMEMDFTEQEMVFAALHHDLGKLGDPDLGPYYVSEDQDWKRRRGEVYKVNPDIQYMDATDRAIYLLQKYQIDITWKEFLAIKLSDGMYKEANKSYLNTFNTGMHLKTELPRVIHIADYMSCIMERSFKKQAEENPIASLVK